MGRHARSITPASWVLVLLAATGCGGGETGTSASSGGPPQKAPVSLSGTVTDVTTFTGVLGAKVCVLGASGACATTDGDGRFVLASGPGDDLAIDVVAAGMTRTIMPVRAGGGDAVLVASVFPDGVLAGAAAGIGLTYDAAKGHLIVIRSEPGATATLTSGKGPYYFSNGMPAPGSKTTVGNGGIGYFDADPGTQELTLTHPKLACDPPAWEGSTPQGGRLPIVAAAVTVIERIHCY